MPRRRNNNIFYNAPPLPPPLPNRKPFGALRAKNNARRSNTNERKNSVGFSNLDPASLRRIVELLNRPKNILAYRAVSKRVRNATSERSPVWANPFGAGQKALEPLIESYKSKFVKLLRSAILGATMFTTRYLLISYGGNNGLFFMPPPNDLRTFETWKSNRVIHVKSANRNGTVKRVMKSKTYSLPENHRYNVTVEMFHSNTIQIVITFAVTRRGQGGYKYGITLVGTMNPQGKLLPGTAIVIPSFEYFSGNPIIKGLNRAKEEITKTWKELEHTPFFDLRYYVRHYPAVPHI